MWQGVSRRLHSQNEGLWAEEVLKLQTKLLVQNYVRACDCDNPEDNVRFRGVRVYRMLDRFELEQLKIRASILPGNVTVDQS